MEKASTPRNRLTRSSAKQVNTPKSEHHDSKEAPDEEIKHNVRKTRRRYDSKSKTNGDTSNIENKTCNDEINEGNVDDKCENEDLNIDMMPQDSPKTPSPIISRRSLRVRRSLTPGPELEFSATKSMKRSSSFGKLDLVSTPIRRTRRANSESKDFVFTPLKDKPIGSHDLNKIDEVNEAEKSIDDELELNGPIVTDLKDCARKEHRFKSSEKDNTGEHLEITDINETSNKATDLSSYSEITITNSSPSKVCNGIEILENSHNDQENTVKETEAEEDNTNYKAESAKTDQESCSLPVEVLPSPISEKTKSPEVVSPSKDKEESSELSKGTVSNSVNESEDTKGEIIVSKSVSKIEDATGHITVDVNDTNLDFITKESAETNKDIHETSSKSNDKSEVVNVETGFVRENERTVADSDENQMDEGVEETDVKHSVSYVENDCESSKFGVETENLEMSQIELIDSSDSEDGPKSSVVSEYKDDKAVSENENVTQLALDEKYGNNTGLVSTEVEEDHSSINQEDDPDIVDLDISCNVQMSDKLSKEDMKSDYFETATQDDEERISNVEKISDQSNVENISDQSKVDQFEENISKDEKDYQGSYFTDKDPNESIILIKSSPASALENMVPVNSNLEIVEGNPEDPLFQDQCPNLDGMGNQNEYPEKDIESVTELKPNNQVTNEPGVGHDNDLKPESEDYYDEEIYEENLDENYENEEELNKSEEGSCDIYKGLSDSGSYVEEQAEGSFRLSSSSDAYSTGSHSSSGGSEQEYATTAEDDEENIEKKTALINALIGPASVKESILSKENENKNEKHPDSPMTYDKALAIINKNRVKKIDDEEFFDMFTQELNRVSEKSGSDSDIAIVDEYLMEPEEPAKKNQPKTGSVQNAKQPSRASDPALPNQPHENYPSDFSQQMHPNPLGHPSQAQHGPPPMQRVNFPQGGLYQQYDQNMHLRGQLMYNQYAHPSSSMHDPHMFNPPMTHTDNFGSGMYSNPHSLGPNSESFPPRNPILNVRSLASINETHKNYTNSEQMPLDERTLERQDVKDGYFNMSSTSVTEIQNTDPGTRRPSISNSPMRRDKKTEKSTTPILDILGLDQKSLKLLKKVLGLNSIRKEMKRDLEWKRKYLRKEILKNELRQRGRKGETRYRNLRQLRDSDSSSFKSSEHSSEDSSVKSSSTSENDNREVNVEDQRVYVTLKTSKPDDNEFHSFKIVSDKESLDTVRRKRKKIQRKSKSSAVELKSKKMTRKQPSVVKSQCGTFTVDPLTTSGQSSESEVSSSLDDKLQVKKLKRQMKIDLASGKNKLSNIFAHHSLKKKKEPRVKVSEPFQEIKGPLRKENLKMRKLPSEILETLAKEEKKKKRHRIEESEDGGFLEVPKKKRKRNQKMKVKSAAVDQNYIPCVTGGATEFGLSRLDKDGTLTLAERAAKFRTDQLYGASVKRITNNEFMNVKKKQNINDSLAKKRKVK